MRVGPQASNGMAAAGLPKADIHLHAETRGRLDRLISRRAGRPAYDWNGWVRRLQKLPPGMPRLEGLPGELNLMDQPAREQELFVDWVAEAMAEGAADGAVLVEIRFGAGWGLAPPFMSRFREAERRTRERYPGFTAEAIITGMWPLREGASEVFEACLRARGEGLAGIDFIPMPYDREADWTRAYLWADRAARAGLGVSAHVGEFAAANIAAALRLPGLTRLGHAVHAAAAPELLKEVAAAGVTVECCLTSNVVLGAVSSLDAHPIRTFVEAGVPVTLSSDDPVRLCTGIGREYEMAAGLGFDEADLLRFTRQGVAASFTSEVRRAELLRALARE